MLPLLLPWIVLTLVILAIIPAFCKKWRIVVLLVILAIAVNWWSECIPFRLWLLCKKADTPSIRVLSFNIRGSKEEIGEKGEELANLIGKDSPDILYLSELSKTNKPFLDNMLAEDYPYNLYNNSHGFYSKYPLEERMTLGGGNVKEGGVLKCLAIMGRDTVALYGCHLASNNYSEKSKYITPDSIKNHSTFMQYVNDIRLAYSKRVNLAGIINRDASQMKKPIIVLGDMNDVGGSKTIRLIETIGLKDAWWEGGFGYGATIHKPLPYRIDHILYSSQLKLNKVKVISSVGLSDHDALYAELSF